MSSTLGNALSHLVFRPVFHRFCRAAALGLAVLPLADAYAGKGHEHGTATLNIALEGQRLTVAFETPLDNLLGFERAPRSASEKQAAADLLARLRKPLGLLAPEAPGACTLVQTDVQAPRLEAGRARSSKPELSAAADHADLDATFSYTCSSPQNLRTLDVGLFDAFKRLQRIDVQVQTDSTQLKATLKRPARLVKLVR
jgi:hypothetical protein